MKKKNKNIEWKIIFSILVIILATAGIVGTSVWYVMDLNMKKEKVANDKLLQIIKEKSDDSSYCFIARKKRNLTFDYNCSTSKEYTEDGVKVVMVTMDRPNNNFIDRQLITINTKTNEIISVAIAN